MSQVNQNERESAIYDCLVIYTVCRVSYYSTILYVRMCKLYLIMAKSWLQSNLPQGRLVSKMRYIEKQYILIYTPITITTIV